MGLNIKEKFKNINKKTVIVIAISLFALLVCVLGGYEYYQYKKFQALKAQPQATMPYDIELGQPKKPSQYQVGTEYFTAIKGKKPVLALFYADWCGYCIRFMPVFQALSEKYGDEMEFAKVNVEDPAYENVVREMGIGGFPTVFILDSKYDNKILLSNSVLSSVDSVSVELERFLKIRRLLDKK